MKPPTLPSGTTGFFNEHNEWVVTGSSMGRRSWRDVFREHRNDPVKVYLKRLRWVDGDYDEEGAYWGGGSGDFIYRANFDIGDTNEDIFVRAFDRESAKELVRQELPNARFFR